MSAIREATEADVPRIVEMGLAFLRGSPYRKHIPENAEQLEALARRVIDSESSAFLVLERDGAPVGMMGLMAYDHFMSGEHGAVELVYWIDPSARGSDGVRLLKAGEAWASSQGAQWLQMISPDARVDQFYERLGYQLVERCFQRPLEMHA
jgi:RimJ/RimL family protein N-acetyltransferase